mgnify:CR=1 FL=1|jgi:hypothetical protein
MMALRLGPSWRAVLRRAWSVRLWALSFACGAADIVLSVLGQLRPEAGWRMGLQLLGLVFAMAGLVARVLVQKDSP